jgi:hypothetical protein
MRTMDAIADARRAAGDLARADELVALRSSELASLHTDMAVRFPADGSRLAGSSTETTVEQTRVEQTRDAGESRVQVKRAGAEGAPSDKGEMRPAAATWTERALDPDVAAALRVSRLSSGSVDQARSATRKNEVPALDRDLTEEELQVQRTAAITTNGVKEQWEQKPTAREVEASSGPSDVRGREGRGQER